MVAASEGNFWNLRLCSMHFSWPLLSVDLFTKWVGSIVSDIQPVASHNQSPCVIKNWAYYYNHWKSWFTHLIFTYILLWRILTRISLCFRVLLFLLPSPMATIEDKAEISAVWHKKECSYCDCVITTTAPVHSP